MAFHSAGLLDKHKAKFCIGTDLKDPIALWRGQRGFTQTENAALKTVHPKRARTPDLIVLKEQRNCQDVDQRESSQENTALNKLTEEFRKLRISFEHNQPRRQTEVSEEQGSLQQKADEQRALDLYKDHEQRLAEIRARNHQLEKEREAKLTHRWITRKQASSRQAYQRDEPLEAAGNAAFYSRTCCAFRRYILYISMPSCGSCRAPLAQGDQHIICVSCLGESHAALALADGGCPHCDLLPMVTLRTRLASFSKSAFPAALPRRKKRRSQRAPEPALARPSSPVRPPASPASPVSLPDAQRPQSAAASSEEVVSEAASGEKDSCSLSVSGSEDWASSVDLAPPARKPTTRANIEKELMRVLVLAAESLGLEWSAPEPPSRTRLDGSFLPGERTSPESKPAPFLPELHEEVAKAWNAPFSARTRSSVSPAFSSLDNAKDRGYLSLPPVEQAIATHLCPPSAGRRTKPVLPSKACRMTSTLLARIFSAAGQAASALHTMATLQIFQGDLLRKWDEMGPEAICIADLRSASDLTLRATKSAAQAMGRCMASATVAERHLWLTLTEMADSERNAFLDAPLSPTGLFGSSLSEFVERFTEAQKASQAFKHFLPKRSGSAASRDKQTPRSSQHQPPPSAASSHQRQQRQQRQQHSSRSRSRSTGRPAQRGPRPRIVVKPEAPKKS
ncbi:unnamed protein product [Leuciscus chuanchicus]